MANSLRSLMLYQICSKLQVLDLSLKNDDLPSLLLATDLEIGLTNMVNSLTYSSDAPTSRLATVHGVSPSISVLL